MIDNHSEEENLTIQTSREDLQEEKTTEILMNLKEKSKQRQSQSQ